MYLSYVLHFFLPHFTSTSRLYKLLFLNIAMNCWNCWVKSIAISWEPVSSLHVCQCLACLKLSIKSREELNRYLKKLILLKQHSAKFCTSENFQVYSIALLCVMNSTSCFVPWLIFVFQPVNVSVKIGIYWPWNLNTCMWICGKILCTNIIM